MQGTRTGTVWGRITAGRSHGNWRTFSLLVAAAMVGCGDLSNDEALEQDALSVVDDNDDGACGAAHDPDRDRDRGFHNRCRHYKHKHRYSRRKAGSAQLAVRALIDKNSVTVLEVTTGTFDDGSIAPGALDKLVVDTTPRSCKRRDSVTFKPRSGGYFSTLLANVIHGQSLTVDATISGIDRGKDRVSVDDQVRYRPDLAVSSIDLPPSAPQGLPVSISATVREMRGDLGARGDCVLAADGVIVDSAAGIWVDAGGAVTCHFTHTFATPGQHAIRVDVGNVKPGDYDMANNGRQALVVVAPQFVFSGDAFDAAYAGADENEVFDSAGNVVFREHTAWAGVLQSVSVNGSWDRALTFPLTRVSATATSGGSSWSLVDVGDLAADSSDATQGTCAARSDTTGFNWITVCTNGTDGVGATNVNVSTFAGDVTYHSEGACRQTTSFRECAGGFTWNQGTTSQSGTRHPLVDSLTVNLAVADAVGTTLQGAPVIPLESYTSRYDVPRTCEPQPGQMQYCLTHEYLETGVKSPARP
jgi:hypothetical protein